jgi:two-component system, response regulator RegA
MTEARDTQDGTSLLIVDDDETFRERLARAFRERGFEVRTASDYEQAAALAQHEAPELAVIDLRMPGRSGLELLRELKRIDAETRVVVLTAYGSIATTIDAMKLGAVYYLQKPADVDDILAALGHDAAAEAVLATPAEQAPSLERVRWEHINRVLSECGGNISEAARRLRLHRRTLQRMLQKYPPRA